MKILCIHAHFDDFEFVAGGAFELWRQRLGAGLRAKVIVCTDGRAGHHFRTRPETGRMRLAEQAESARAGGYEFEPLRLPNGEMPREACLRVSPDFLAALWKAIRDFEPDYLFCPPVAADPLAGIHVDHIAVAQAVREVAYMINVPHAFTPEYPADETQSRPVTVPVILNTYDGYMHGANSHDLAVDIGPVFEAVARMTWCHQSQIAEWLPWVGRHQMPVPKSLEEWREILKRRFLRESRGLGHVPPRLLNVFTVTAWGEIPDYDRLVKDFPGIIPEASNLARLKERLARWRMTPE